jgi:hypothetical protein
MAVHHHLRTRAESFSFGHLNSQPQRVEEITRHCFFSQLYQAHRAMQRSSTINMVAVCITAVVGSLAGSVFSNQICEIIKDRLKKTIPSYLVTTIITAFSALTTLFVARNRSNRSVEDLNEFCMRAYRNLLQDKKKLLFGKPISFPLPANIESLSNESLRAICHSYPVKYQKYGGTKLRVEIDCSRIENGQLQQALFLLHCAYHEKISRLVFTNLKFSSDDIEPFLADFERLKGVGFTNCNNITDEDVRRITDSLPALCGIGLVGCDRITREFCDELAQKYLVVYPDRTSNMERLKTQFMEDIFNLRNQELMVDVKKKMASLEGEAAGSRTMSHNFVKLIRLDRILEKEEKSPEEGEEINRLALELKDYLDPQEKTPEERAATRTHLNQYITTFKDKSYYPLFESEFSIDFSDLYMGDASIITFLRTMRLIDASLISINLSRTASSGEWLRSCYGMPLRSLHMEGIQHFSPQWLTYVKDIPALEVLDISRNKLDRRGLICGIKRLSKIRSLLLDFCENIIESSFLRCILHRISSLRFLSFIDAQNSFGEPISDLTRDTIMARACEVKATPLLMLTSLPGIGNSLDLSVSDFISTETYNRLSAMPTRHEISAMRFSKGTRLSYQDFEGREDPADEKLRHRGLFSIEKLANLHFLNLENVEFETTDAINFRRWPLKFLKLPEAVFEIDDIKPTGQTETFNVITIALTGSLSNIGIEYLNSFPRMHELTINHTHEISEEDRAFFRSYCEAKGIPLERLTFNKI